MSPTDQPAQYNPPSQNLSFLYQRHRSRVHEFQTSQRTNNLGNHEPDRRETYGEKFTRMYPREVRQTSAANQRYPSPSSPHPVTSPLLSALGSTTNTAAQYTSDWTKSLPFFASGQPSTAADSPPNAIPIQGSPRIGISSSPSPPSMKPHSQPNNNGLSPRMHPSRERRASLYSQTDNLNNYRGSAPPLPHEDQAHFHPGGLPDFDSIGVPQQVFNGLMPGEKGYFCGWDTLGNAGHAPSSNTENVLIIGYEGGVNIYRITKKDKPFLVGSLKGLKGAVIDAKILPWTSRKDPGAAGRPYIALVIHGPVIEDNGEPQNSSDESAVVSAEEDSQAPSTRPSSRRGQYQPVGEMIKSYQTTVEIYSLQTSTYVETIYATPPSLYNIPVFGECKPPHPSGDIKIDANGKFLIVASGESGEIFIFSPGKRSNTKTLEGVHCIGKLWTTVERRSTHRASTSSASGRTEATADDAESQRGVPIFSLSQRFLAIVPPNSSSSYSINGIAQLLDNARKPPGVGNHVAPLLASSTCDTDDIDGNDFVNRMSREVAQQAVKAGAWVKDRGMEAWKSYWNGDPAAINSAGNRASYPPADLPPVSRFPPTHGYNGPVNQSQVAQVAIFDLQRFLDAEDFKIKNVLSPAASFDLASGCSLLSFSPTGLHMLTVSRKGDEQTVWSLMKMRDPRSANSTISNGKPMVRNIFRVTRMTVTKIIDVAWTEPHGQRFALLSENGTVHVNEIPASKFQWPPMRRVRRAKPAQRAQSEESRPSKAGLGYAMGAINGASSWVNTVRQRSLSGHVTLGGLAMTPANLSTKAVKAGFRQSASAVAKGVNNLYHVNDNKLHMHSKLDVLRPRSIRLLTGRSLHGYLGVVAAGTVYLYPIHTVTSARSSGPSQYHAKIAKNGIRHNLEAIPSDLFAPIVKATIMNRTTGAVIPPEESGVSGNWTLRAPLRSQVANGHAAVMSTPDWRAMIEADTNPPYQPFHTDRRVALYAFAEPDVPPPYAPDIHSSQLKLDTYADARRTYEEEVLVPHLRELHHVSDERPWLFGGEAPGTRLIREGAGAAGGVEGAEEDMEYMVMTHEGNTLVLNTVARTAAAERADEEFFEDGAELVDYSDGVGRV